MIIDSYSINTYRRLKEDIPECAYLRTAVKTSVTNGLGLIRYINNEAFTTWVIGLYREYLICPVLKI